MKTKTIKKKEKKMGRTKGSKNGVRKVPIRKFKIRQVQESETESENYDSNVPIINSNVLRSYKSKRYGKCIELIQKILNINTDENKDHYKILLAASLIMLRNEIDKAHSILDEVLKWNPTNYDALYAKGVAFYFEQKMDESVEMFDKALESNPGPEMEKARDMKMRIDFERRKVVIVMEKFGENKENHQVAAEKEENKSESMDELKILEAVEDKTEINIEGFKTNGVHEANKTPELKPVNSETISSSTSPKIQANTPKLPVPEIEESLPKSFKPKTADEYYLKGMELYMSGSLKKSLKMFEKSIQIDSNLTKSDDMGTKAQEFLELIDTASMNMKMENYAAVVEIVNEALEVDPENAYVNRPFYFQRGLALFHLGRNEESLKDYAEFDKLNKLLSDK